ncbi:hypothetical protein IFM89_033822 [Coptis chinensis]|uniref:RRM domain-containing protein n=1 Tax=Coptis chinensis TaxID=261450 RepID=A0A835LSD1_9MAGN|nr:hypothetical protein IFM89_033822 [Coptis chinensis]
MVCEVFRCNKQDYYRAMAVAAEDQLEYILNFLSSGGPPLLVTKSNIVEFFDEFELAKDSTYIACRLDGKATGEAYVEVGSVDDARKAMDKDKMTIGSRYVELFTSTPDEARQSVQI